jgi:hypothetical protein
MQAEHRVVGVALLWLRLGYWGSLLISVAVVLRRVVILTTMRGTPDGLDSFFASRAALTLAHILPALAFVVLTPLVLLRSAPRANWAQRLLYPLGAMVGLTAYAMSQEAVGGWVERTAVWCFNSWFLYSLMQAYRRRQRGQQEVERRWLVRAMGVLFGIATTRPVMGVFFATRGLTYLEPSQFFGLAFWIGFGINTVLVEWWLWCREASGDGLTARQASSQHAVL